MEDNKKVVELENAIQDENLNIEANEEAGLKQAEDDVNFGCNGVC